MTWRPGKYARRTVDAAIVAHAEATLSDTPASGSAASADPRHPRTVVLLGEPGNGARMILTHGVLPQLLAPSATIAGTWAEGAVIQVCMSPEHVPVEPPPVESAARLLFVTCTDLTALPGWFAPGSSSPAQVFNIDTLSLAELDDYLETRLGGAVNFGAARALGSAAGFIPAILSRLVRDAQETGRLEQIDGAWHLIGEPVEETVTPYIRARLAALPDDAAETVFRIALAEPVSLSALSTDSGGVPSDDTAAALEQMRAEGILREDPHGEFAFRVPAVLAAIRRLCPADLKAEVYRAAIAARRVTPQSTLWALQHAEPIPESLVDGAVAQSLELQNWAEAIALIEVVLASGGAAAAPIASPEAAERHCALRLLAASAARQLPDAGQAHAHLDETEKLLDLLPLSEPAAMRTRIALARAEILHFTEGDLDGALEALDDHPGHSEAVRAEILSHRVIHLALAGEAGAVEHRVAAEQRVLRRAEHNLRTRVKLAHAIIRVSCGRPKQALRKALVLSARNVVSSRLNPTVSAELKSVIVLAALGSGGPSAYPALAKQLDTTRDEADYRPDLVAFNLGRARWAYATGKIGRAHRIAGLALTAAEYSDPAGVEPAIVALLAETSAILGDVEGARAMLRRFSQLPLRASGALAGSIDANIAFARLLLGEERAGTRLGEVAWGFNEGERYGFAAEVLYSGIRVGHRHAASMLLDIATRLDGELHGLRVEHAAAVHDTDPLKLIAVAEELERAGLNLYAAEAAALAAQSTDVPQSVRKRASGIIASAVDVRQLGGHALLAELEGSRPAQSLTRREREVAELIDLGLSNSEIAAHLHLSQRTVEGHIARLYLKTGESRRSPGRRRWPR